MCATTVGGQPVEMQAVLQAPAEPPPAAAHLDPRARLLGDPDDDDDHGSGGGDTGAAVRARGCWCCRRFLAQSSSGYDILGGGGGGESGAAEQALTMQFVAMSFALSLNHASVVACLSLSVSTLGDTIGPFSSRPAGVVHRAESQHADASTCRQRVQRGSVHRLHHHGVGLPSAKEPAVIPQEYSTAKMRQRACVGQYRPWLCLPSDPPRH